MLKPLKYKPRTVFTLLVGLTFLYFFWLMLRITLDYIPYSANVSFLQIKQTEVQGLPPYRYIFYAHVYTSIFVLLAGFFQFFRFRKGRGALLHRYSGYVYIVLLLAFTAPSGLYMGIYANGGIGSKVSFILLSLMWWLSTYIAFTKIKQRNIMAHRNWIVISYALTLSAITLRMWKVLLVKLFYLPPMEVYQIIAWLGWVPNLLAALLIITKSNQPKL